MPAPLVVAAGAGKAFAAGAKVLAKLAATAAKQGGKAAAQGAKQGAKTAAKGAKQGAKAAGKSAKTAGKGAKLAGKSAQKGSSFAMGPGGGSKKPGVMKSLGELADTATDGNLDGQEAAKVVQIGFAVSGAAMKAAGAAGQAAGKGLGALKSAA